MLNQGTKSERLGRDAMKNYDACSLCLERAREPRVCDHGHLFCQECIISSLLSQKKDIKRQSLLLEKMKETELVDAAAAKVAARERVLKDFEHTQTGLAALSSTSTAAASSSAATTSRTASSLVVGGVKRKFDLDSTEIERLTRESEEVAAKKIALELVEARKAKLPNFWLPSLTPNAAPAPMAEIKLQTLCNVTKPTHPLSLKTLTTVNLTVDETDTTGGEKNCICPVCKKGLSNNVKAFVLKPCGHVVCVMCLTTLCLPDSECAHCGTKLEKDKKNKLSDGTIELRVEGTGYSAGGQAEGKRFDLAFQG